MALTLEASNLVKQRTQATARGAHIQSSLRAFWEQMEYLRHPDLKIKFFSGLDSADVVASDSACKLYALYAKKPTASTTNAWLKISNHATTAAANGDVTLFLVGTSGGGLEYLPTFCNGLPLGTGCTVGSHTTVNGNTKSGSGDGPTGFIIVGAP